jgi:hypothetical protein
VEQPARDRGGAATLYPEASQEIEVLGLPVTTYLGVQTFSLSPRANAIAFRQGVPCGYERRIGAGSAVLLGSWPAAANGRSSTYVLTGGALAYWNGDQVVGVAQITTTPDGSTQVISPVLYAPADAAHVAVIAALIGAPPQIRVSDLRIQARVLDAPEQRAASVVANNRWPQTVPVRMSTIVAGRTVSLSRSGAITLDPGEGCCRSTIRCPTAHACCRRPRSCWGPARRTPGLQRCRCGRQAPRR